MGQSWADLYLSLAGEVEYLSFFLVFAVFCSLFPGITLLFLHFLFQSDRLSVSFSNLTFFFRFFFFFTADNHFMTLSSNCLLMLLFFSLFSFILTFFSSLPVILPVFNYFYSFYL